MITATAQIERGTNRIYGIRRDRPALLKYGRAAVLTLVLMVPVGTGFVLLVGGGALGDALTEVYGWDPGRHLTWDLVRWPAGLLTTTFTIAVLLDHVPRRRQPALSWLALGSGVAVVLTTASTALLALYVRLSTSFDEVYGPRRASSPSCCGATCRPSRCSPGRRWRRRWRLCTRGWRAR